MLDQTKPRLRTQHEKWQDEFAKEQQELENEACERYIERCQEIDLLGKLVLSEQEITDKKYSCYLAYKERQNEIERLIKFKINVQIWKEDIEKAESNWK